MAQERRKYGALGWNVAPAFNASDLETAMVTLQVLLRDMPAAVIPYHALEHLIGLHLPL